MPPLPRFVPDHHRLVVAESLHLHERARPPRLVLRPGFAEHQPLAAKPLHPRQLLAQVVDAAAQLVGVERGERRLPPREAVPEEPHPLLERPARRRGIEHQEADLLPGVRLVLPADDADRPLERFAGDPQLAVERQVGQPLDEPVGSVVKVALAGDELLAVPVRPHAVELLAHPPPGEVAGVVPRLGEEDRRAGGVAAQLAEVLARPPLDRGGLVPPRRAGAGVHPADVP